jgi:hypothetical protein
MVPSGLPGGGGLEDRFEGVKYKNTLFSDCGLISDLLRGFVQIGATYVRPTVALQFYW